MKVQVTHGSGRSSAAFLALAAAALFASCSGTVSRKPAIEVFNDMRQQPKYYPQGESAFNGFNDGRADRRPIPGTIRHPAYDSVVKSTNDPFNTGQVSGICVTQNQVPITPELLQLGQARFNTYCSPCHGRAGNGKGIVGARSTWIASSLVDDRVQGFTDGICSMSSRTGAARCPPAGTRSLSTTAGPSSRTSGLCSVLKTRPLTTSPHNSDRSCAKELHGTRDRRNR